MKINQLYLIGSFNNAVKFYLNYLIALKMSIKLKDLLRKFKALIEAK